MSTSAIISLIFTIGFWILFLYVVIRARKKRKARQAEATAQTGISKTFFGRVISSLGRFFSLLFLAVVGIMMILGIVGLIVSDNKTDEVAETGQETATTETNAEAKTYYVKSGAANIRECPSTSCKVINTLPQNTELTFPGDLFDKYPDWAEITFPNGEIGYVSKTTLSENTVPESQLTPTDDSSSMGGITIGPWSNLQMTLGDSYELYFCEPSSAISGATCGALADTTTDPRGGTPPYSFIKKSGFLPPGITLELNGTLKGAPTQEGSYNFRLCAKDLYGGEGCQNLAAVVTKDGGAITDQPKSEQPSTDTSLDLTVNGTCRFIKNVVDDEGKIRARYYTVEFIGTAAGPVYTFMDYETQKTMNEQYGDPDSWKKFEAPSWTPYYGTARRETGDPSVTTWKYTLSNGYSASQTNYFRLWVYVKESGGYPRIEKEFRVECP